MKKIKWGLRIGAVAIICLVAMGSLRSMTPRTVEGHRSALQARITTVDGTQGTITLQGVGCTESMCSRVVVGCVKTDSLWLDSLTSISDISPNRDGSVKAVFTFKSGAESAASVLANNRVLYVSGLFRTEKLDLGTLSRIDFMDR
jgi:hypothetical protein